MKIRRAALFGAMFASLLRGAETDIQFVGVVTAEGKTRIALTDKAQKSTTWVEPGQKFQDYTVARYDEKEEAVYLKRGGRETRLVLATPKTTEARPTAEIAPNVAQATPAAQAAAIATSIRSNLRQLATAARQVQAERGVDNVAFTDLVGPDKLIKDLKPVAGENYSTINFGPNVTAVSVTTSGGGIVTYDMPPAAPAATAATPAAPAAPAVSPAPRAR